MFDDKVKTNLKNEVKDEVDNEIEQIINTNNTIADNFNAYNNSKKEQYDNNIAKLADYINKNGKVLIFTELGTVSLLFIVAYNYFSI